MEWAGGTANKSLGPGHTLLCPPLTRVKSYVQFNFCKAGKPSPALDQELVMNCKATRVLQKGAGNKPTIQFSLGLHRFSLHPFMGQCRNISDYAPLQRLKIKYFTWSCRARAFVLSPPHSKVCKCPLSALSCVQTGQITHSKLQ